MKKILLSLLLWSVPAFALAATTFVWTQPSKNQDGTPLIDLKGNKIYCGISPLQYTIVKDVGLPAGVGATARYPIASVLPQPDVYYCAVTAYDTKNNESGKSNEVADPLELLPPLAVTGFGVE